MIPILLILLLFVSAGTVQASLKDWMLDKLQDNHEETSTHQYTHQLQETFTFNHSLELEPFLTSTTTSTKSNIENHQTHLMKELADATSRLSHNPLTHYTEERSAQLDSELTEELEQYLAELIKNNKGSD